VFDIGASVCDRQSRRDAFLPHPTIYRNLRLLERLIRSTAKTTGAMRRTIKIVASSAPVPLSGEMWNICSMKFMWTSVSHHDTAERALD
jgi:hypothetical protein